MIADLLAGLARRVYGHSNTPWKGFSIRLATGPARHGSNFANGIGWLPTAPRSRNRAVFPPPFVASPSPSSRGGIGQSLGHLVRPRLPVTTPEKQAAPTLHAPRYPDRLDRPASALS